VGRGGAGAVGEGMMFEVLVLMPWGAGAMVPGDGGAGHPLMGIEAAWPGVSFWVMVGGEG
jgi:hypothetical protein